MCEQIDSKHDAGMHDNGETICDSLPQDKEVEVDNKDMGFEAELHCIESSQGKNPLNNNQSLKDDKAAMKEDTLGTIDFCCHQKHLLRQPSELAKVCEDERGTEAKVENDSSTETSVDLVEIPSSISAVPEEQGTEEVIVGQMPNHFSVPVEALNIHETKEFSNGSLKTEQTIMPTSGTEVSVAKYIFVFCILFESWN